MGFTRRVGMPFRESEYAAEAYGNAAYISVTYGLELDGAKGELTVRVYKTSDSNEMTVFKGCPADVLTHPGLYVNQMRDDHARIDTAFVMGYMLAQLAQERDDG